jgi:CDP-diacylglycerol--glycerol-3-phosphate 3-phosphatidyltransferase
MGKVKTTAQALALGGFVAPFGLLTGGLAGLGDLVWWLAAATMLVAVVLTLTSGAEFARDVVRDRAERRTAATS